MEDLVSIITPSYNTGRWIAETIESVLNQTYQNWEMIIVDDCSSDNTDEVVAQYDDKRIRYLKNEKNSGAAVSRNRAIREAKGDFIAFLDSDDLWVPNKLEKQIKYMKDNNYAFTCGYSDCIDENSNSIPGIDTCPKRIGRIGMLAYNWVGCLTAMYHVPTVGLIQIEDIPKRNDYAIWLQVVQKAPCYGYPEVLGHYRVRKNSVSHVGKWKLIQSHYNMFRKCEHMNPISSVIMTVINMVMAVYRKLRYFKRTE